MKRKNLHNFKSLWLLLACLAFSPNLFAQAIATITATGPAGSYNTGSVSSSGTKNDDLMPGLADGGNRGWAVFDLSGIPTGSTINSVNVVFTTTSNSLQSGVTNFIGGYAWSSATDPATYAGGSLYTSLGADATTNFNASTWTANATMTLPLNASGASLISNSLGGKVVISYNRGSGGTNIYEIFGYSSASAPQLVIDYLPSIACSGMPTAGTANASSAAVCPGIGFNLSLSGATAASGLTYQWYEAPAGTGVFTPISGANTATYSVSSISANTDYQATVTCAGQTATSTIVSVSVNPFLNCYCASGATNTGDEEIYSFTLDGVNSNSLSGQGNGCTTVAPGPGSILNRYSNFTTLGSLTSLTQGQSYAFDIEEDECDGPTYYGNGAAIWVDWNQDGIFDNNTEKVYVENSTSLSPRHALGNILVPINALPGQTGMRVTVAEGQTGTNLTSCLSYGYGETEDYLVDIVQTVACSGVPSAGIIGSSQSSVCTGQAFTLASSGYTAASGVTFQWYESPSGGGTFSAISNATDPNYIVTSQGAATDYYLEVSCTNPGGGTVTSNTITVGQNSFLLCYCTSTPTSGDYDDIFDVTINGVSNTSTCSTTGDPATSVLNRYSDYTSVLPALSMTQGDIITFSVTNGGCNFGAIGSGVAIFVDFDQDGIFNTTTEKVYGSPNYAANTTYTGTFLVPLSAAVGTTRMRVVDEWFINGTSIQPCNTSAYSGETEDYYVDIQPAIPCSGAPSAGTASSNVSSICANQSFNLSATGYTSGQGITFQWYEDAGGGPNPISGATNPVYIVSTGITVPTSYYLEVACTNPGGSVVNSNTVSVTVNSPILCYCASGATNTGDEEIYSFTFNGVNSNTLSGQGNGCTTVAPGPGSVLNKYSNFTTLGSITSVTQGQSYAFDIEENECDGPTYYGNGAAIWVDWNQDGVFDNTTEKAYVENSTSLSPRHALGNIMVPINALPGQTGMRVTVAEGQTGTNLTSCLSYGYGETEDYLIDIVQAVACAGTPSAGTAIASQSSVCTGTSFTLSSTGYTAASGITFQWYSNTGSGATAIANATDPSYTVTSQSVQTDYYLEVSCTNPGGSTVVSNTVTVGQNGFNLCYCTTNLGGGTTPSIEMVEIPTTTLSNSTPGTAATFYTAYPASGNTTATLLLGSTYTINGTFNASAIASVWIDYNHSGTFDASEHTQIGLSGTTMSATFTIPVNATLGQTGMRVRSRSTGSPNGPTDACTQFFSGETEDYVITIDAPVACSGTPSAGTVSGPSSVCTGISFSLTNTGATTGASGLTYQWQSRPAGSGGFTNISGANNINYSTTQSSATDYRLYVSCSNSGLADTSAFVTVGQTVPGQCYCTPTYTNACSSNDDINDFILNGENSTMINDLGTGCSPANYYNGMSLAPVDLAAGVSYSGMISSDYAFGLQYVRIWIDFGDDGVFDAADQVGTVSNFANTQVPFTVTLPATAALGNHRMRIRDVYNGNPASSIDPCTNAGYGETHDYIVNVVPPPACLAPTSVTASNITGTTADFSWTAVAGAAGYEYTVDQTSAAPAGAGANTTTTATGSASGLTGSTTYYVHVRTDCGGGSFSSWTTLMFMTGLVNDEAVGATTLTVGAACSGTPNGTLVGSTVNASDPSTPCGTGGGNTNSVWFKFTPPASGAVKISTDHPVTNGLEDTRIAVFTTSNPATGPFNLIGCDEDNGGYNSIEFNSVLYLTGLSTTTDYYIKVDKYSSIVTDAPFCIDVMELNDAMLSSNSACGNGNGENPTPLANSGWISFVDNSDGALIANVNSGSNTLDYLSGDVYISPTPRNSNGISYLDRNYHINADTQPITPVDVQFFFTDAELASLGVPLSAINVTRQTGSNCVADFDASQGTNSLLTQTSNGTANGANWVTVQTPGFSNYYLNAGNSPLLITLGDIRATNLGNRNRVDWNTLGEHAGDKFEIERSADSRTFTKIGGMNAVGTANTYSFFDEQPIKGINYYRLKMIDKAGVVTYSKVVNATVKGFTGFAVTASPNPITGNSVTVVVNGTMSADAMIVVTDVTGKIVRTVTATSASTTIDMNNLSAGMYLVRYTDKDHTETVKVTKQ